MRGVGSIKFHGAFIVQKRDMSQDHSLQRAKEIILAGGVVAMPTETVYGLAASIRSEEGLKKIFAIKERPFFDPLIVHICDLDQKNQVVREWPKEAQALADSFWPGPLTMVLPKNSSISPLITSGLDTVGLRFPKHPLAQQLIDLCRVPLAAPSANKFGKTSPTKAEHVRKSFEKDGLCVVDGGQSEIGLESTVISFGENNGKRTIFVLRPGAITAELMQNVLKEKNLSVDVERAQSTASPGHTEHHYMPSIPLLIIESESHTLLQKQKQIIATDFCLDTNGIGAELRLDRNPKLAARELYSRMRECAESGADFIYVMKHADQNDGLWVAIWDRLQRASSRIYR